MAEEFIGSFLTSEGVVVVAGVCPTFSDFFLTKRMNSSMSWSLPSSPLNPLEVLWKSGHYQRCDDRANLKLPGALQTSNCGVDAIREFRQFCLTGCKSANFLQ